MDDLSNTSMNSDDTSTVSSKKTKENNNLFWLIKI